MVLRIKKSFVSIRINEKLQQQIHIIITFAFLKFQPIINIIIQ